MRAKAPNGSIGSILSHEIASKYAKMAHALAARKGIASGSNSEKLPHCATPQQPDANHSNNASKPYFAAQIGL